MKEINKKNKDILRNPPSSDLGCYCCGKHISELKPYGKAGDIEIDDCSKEFLLKQRRPMGPYNEKAIRAVKKAYKHYADDGYKGPLEWMIGKFGIRAGENLYYSEMASRQLGSSLECRDCFFLNTDEYYEECYRRYRKKV
jgi:hypothetical protein